MRVTIEAVRAALSFLPADLARDDWVRIGMALKAEFPGEEGFDLFNEWSATAATYKAKDARSTWKSIKASGGVGIGTLIHEAKANGYVHASAPALATSTADSTEQAQQRAVQRLADEARRQAEHVAVAKRAADQWTGAALGVHQYLKRKGIQAHGVRVSVDGWLLVPLTDADGKLWNLQRIAPTKPASGPDKLFLKGGRKSGLWHMLGAAAEADAVLVAEGYATAASLHECTGRPVAVAFDAGNLVHVARALRKLFPDAMLVICGDDDQATHEATGVNPGREKAYAAAKAVRGAVAFPSPLAQGGSDFNDLHAQGGSAAVRDVVEGVIAEHRAAASRRAPSGRKAQVTEAGSIDVFDVADSGVWFVGVDQDGKRKPPEWVCSRLDVAALTRDQDGAGWGYLLQFPDALGNAKQWAMPARMLSGDGGEYRAALLNMGLRIAASPRARTLLAQYIQSRTPGEFAQCTDRIGWHGKAFVLPKETVGDEAERIVFQSDSQMENTFRSKGDKAQWRDRVGRFCAGNSRLVFAVSSAFAGPLLRPAGVESGGFHLRGDSSSGKTTALKLAASVYGGANYLQRWRTTDNALEAIAAQHCDSLLILDELAQVDPKTAGECAYMLANEQSKARSTRTGMPRARLSWRLLFLSAGELGLADHMAEGMKRARTGQEVRMADIPADAGAGLGMFENLHGHEGGAAFARHLTHGAAAFYGAPGRAFIEWACSHADTLSRRVREAAALLASQLVPQGSSGQVERVGARFALVGVAGELATEAGLTGWQAGEAESAAQACFKAWLASRGGIGNGEVASMLRAVQRFIEVHGTGRFGWMHRGADDHAPAPLQRAGFRRMLNEHGEPIKTNSQHAAEFGQRMPDTLSDGVSVEYLVLPEVFRTEVCMGFDHKAVCRVLVDHGCLVPDKDGRLTRKTRVPGVGGAVNCYCLTPKLLELDV